MKQEVNAGNSFLSRLLLYLNIPAAILLLISQTASLISPASYWPLEILAIFYPFFLILNLIFLVLWGAARNRYFFLSASIILMGYDKLGQFYQPSFLTVDVMPPPGAVKVMSYNVRLFDLYNWTGNLKTRHKIFKLLKSEHPDILCLQEYFHSDKGNFQNNDTLKKLLNLDYSSIKYSLTLQKTNHWGLATFSRFPILNEGTVFFQEGQNNFCLYSDLLINKDTVRVYNVHLQSNHFKQKDYNFIENPDSTTEKGFIEGAKSILKRIRKAVVTRSNQVDELKAHMEQSPYPVILCGDFNDPPFSYAYQTLKKDIKDSFTEKGEGFGITYLNPFLKFRIDYILHSPNMQTYSFQTINRKFSDHRPIQAWLKIKK